MGTPRISYERAKEAVDAASAALLQGLGARQGARRLGITENALQARLRVAKFFYGLEPVGAPNPSAVEFDTSAPVKQRIRVKAPSSRHPEHQRNLFPQFHRSPHVFRA